MASSFPRTHLFFSRKCSGAATRAARKPPVAPAPSGSSKKMGSSFDLNCLQRTGNCGKCQHPRPGSGDTSLPATPNQEQGLKQDGWASGRTLTSVDDDVLGQVPYVHEGFAAHAALVRADVVMVANVIGQLAGLDESAGPQAEGSHGTAQAWARGSWARPPAPSARLKGTPGPMPGLGQPSAQVPTEPSFVSRPPAAGGERGPHGAQNTEGTDGAGPLAAALADVGLLPSVLAHVGDEGAGLGEGLAAHHALAWLLAWGRGRRCWHLLLLPRALPDPRPGPAGPLTHPCGCGRAAAGRRGPRTVAGSGRTRTASLHCGSEGAA